jgi:hypothetical protein
LLSTLGPSPSLDRFGLDRSGTTLQLQQQWGIVFILASVATVLVVAEGFCAAVAQLASRFLFLDTPRNRFQLSEAVALLMEQLRPG